MGSTGNFDLPYPEGSDLVIGGDDAIEALAERLDYILVPDASLTVSEHNSGRGVGGATAVDFPGTLSSGGFTVNGGRDMFTYVGPDRFFMVSASVELDTGVVSTSSFSSTVTLLQNGVVIDSSHDSIDSSAIDLVRRRVVHKVCVPVQLATNETISVTAYLTPAGGIGATSLRIYPIGPKL